jgi:hypothetical protein
MTNCFKGCNVRASSYSLLQGVRDLIDVDRNATMIFAADHFEYFAQNTREVLVNPQLLVLLNQLKDFSPLLDNNSSEVLLCAELTNLLIARWNLASIMPEEQSLEMFSIFCPLLIRFKILGIPNADLCYQIITANYQSERIELNNRNAMLTSASIFQRIYNFDNFLSVYGNPLFATPYTVINLFASSAIGFCSVLESLKDGFVYIGNKCFELSNWMSNIMTSRENTARENLR